jgi:hypothetical protein
MTAQKDAASKKLIVSLSEYTESVASYQDALAARKAAESELEATNERIVGLKADLSKRAESMYRQGPFALLDLLLGSTSFKEFTTTWDILQTINDQQASLIEQMRELKVKQGELLDESKEQEQRASQLMDEIGSQTSKLESQIADLESSIDDAKAEALRLQRLEAAKLAQAIVADAPTPSNPYPSNLGDGAWDSTISALLSKYGLSQSWLPIIRNIIWRESGNNPNAVGGGGAYVGLCQFGAHWAPPKGWKGSGDWRFDPVASIERMVQYIAETGGLGDHWAATNY